MLIRAMSFNLKRSRKKSGKFSWQVRYKSSGRLIQSLSPDIIGTQELTYENILLLCGILSEYDFCGIGRRGGIFGEHSAIFYKKNMFDLCENGTFWLSTTPKTPSISWYTVFPRVCTWCVLKLKSGEFAGKKIRIYNTHLDCFSSVARMNGLALIRKMILEHNKKEKLPVILTGDMNATPKSAVIRSVLELKNSYDYLKQQKKEIGASYHGYNGTTEGAPIDYIFTSSDIITKKLLIERNKVDGIYPSDHYPVIADLEVDFSHEALLCGSN